MASIFYKVKISFTKLKCIFSGENFHAEPYLWIIYYLFDGSMVTGELKEERDENNDKVTNCYIEKATQSSHHAFVWGMGDSHGHGNIGGDMQANQERPLDLSYEFGDLIPISLYWTRENGDRTLMDTNFKGYFGTLAILMEQDQTDDEIINNAYHTLKNAVQDGLDEFLDNLKFNFTEYCLAVIQADIYDEPPPEIVPDSDIAILSREIHEKVTKRIEEAVFAAGCWEVITNFVDSDETLGSEVWIFDSDVLEEFVGEGTTGNTLDFSSEVMDDFVPGVWIPIGNWAHGHGKWKLFGKIYAKKLKCFIATAAYGSPIAPQVNFLRYVRNRVLKMTIFGSLFVDAYEWIYYKFSPHVAVAMEQHRRFKTFMKWIVVNPIVYFLIGILRPFHKIRKSLY